MTTTDTNRCNGIKTNGSRCGMTRMTNWSGRKSHITPAPWFCHLHKDQDVTETTTQAGA